MLFVLSKLSQWGFYVSIWEASWPVTKMEVAMIAVLIVLGGVAFAAQYFLRRRPWLHNAAAQVWDSTRNKLLAFAGFLILVLAAPLVVMPVTTLVAEAIGPSLRGTLVSAALWDFPLQAGYSGKKRHIPNFLVAAMP